MKVHNYLRYKLKYDVAAMICKIFGHKLTIHSFNTKLETGSFCSRYNCTHFKKDKL